MAYITGVFCCEGKTRFVADVEVEQRLHRCYVPTSTKLSRYLAPEGRQVRLRSVKGHLVLEQIRCGRAWVLVNSSRANLLLKEFLERRGYKVQAEKTEAGYRFDLYSRNVGYEVKSIITDKCVLVYPNADSVRREAQLVRLAKLRERGQRVAWAFVSLSPTLNRLIIDTGSECGRLLLNGRNEGMRIMAYRVRAGRTLQRLPISWI